MVPPSMTLSDLLPGFQGHDIFEVECQKNRVKTESNSVLKTVTIAQEESIPNIWNGTIFDDLD